MVLIALLLRSMWRTHVPGEWLGLRDKLVALPAAVLNAIASRPPRR